MESISVTLPNGESFSAPVLDSKNRGELSPLELSYVTRFIIQRLKAEDSLAALEPLPSKTPYVHDSEIAETKAIPFLRHAGNFSGGLNEAIERVVAELNLNLVTFSSEAWLEVGYSNGENFGPQNFWGDYGYIFARVLRK